MQVTVDNTPPEVQLINPEPERVYVLEDDEWINFQVDALDNFSMNRVEYFMDNQKIGDSTVDPYTLRWNLALSDTQVVWEKPVTQSVVITQPDGVVVETGEFITLTHVLTVTQPITDPEELAALPPGAPAEKEIGYQKVYSDGWTIISTTLGYTESHLIHVVAYDSAGNETKTEPIRIYIIHEEKEEEEEPTASEEQSFILPSVNDRFRYHLRS